MTTQSAAVTGQTGARAGYPRRWLAAVVMIVGALMAMIDVTIVNVALPTIRRDLHASATQLEWVVSGYMLAFAAALIIAGNLGDRFGRSYYQSAVDSYRFLIREYPASKLSQDAMLKVAALEKDQLGDPRAAAKIYDDFLKKYPHSSKRRDAQEARAELALTLGETGSKGDKNSRGGAAVAAKNSDESDDEDTGAATGGVAPLPPATPNGGMRCAPSPSGPGRSAAWSSSSCWARGRARTSCR